ncbi:hypothetical protein MRBBS_0161 [Marinobacter sp. BSs20148]|nr:hypothetical protein MRBBS_0161 [Marinobacter sp. BSs20148]
MIDNVPDMLADDMLISRTKALSVQSSRHLVKQLDKLPDRMTIFINDLAQGPVIV